MKTLSLKTLAAVFGFAISAAANANLIVNGGFEDNDVAPGTWSYFSSAAVNGWDGSNIEIWDHLFGISPAEGQQHAELNAHPYTGSAFSIYQNFATEIGQTYDLSFFYSARGNNHEEFSFSVASLSSVLNDHVVGSWTQYTNSFVATSSLSTITFTTVAPYAGTVGNFLDGVSVAKSSVSEPASIALFGMGLVGLGLARRRKIA